jgi:sRNA-binding carbon storage regulator CsrA
MLVIGRKRDEKLIIAGNIEITVLKVGRNHVKFGVEAPREIQIQTRTREPRTSAAASAAPSNDPASGRVGKPAANPGPPEPGSDPGAPLSRR